MIQSEKVWSRCTILFSAAECYNTSCSTLSVSINITILLDLISGRYEGKAYIECYNIMEQTACNFVSTKDQIYILDKFVYAIFCEMTYNFLIFFEIGLNTAPHFHLQHDVYIVLGLLENKYATFDREY